MAGRRKEKGTQSYPVDPHDLHRRLCVVLAERKAEEAAQRRLNRNSTTTAPARGDGIVLPTTQRRDLPRPRSAQLDRLPFRQDDDYHHVPQVAASQFEDTTTSDSIGHKGLSHRLSKRAMDFHRIGWGNGVGSVKSTTLEEAREAHEKALRRNQFRSTEMPRDTDDHVSSPLTHMSEPIQSVVARRPSGGDILWRAATGGSGSLEKPRTSDGVLLGNPTEYPVDWSQSDENRRFESPPKTASFKKSDFWGLGGKFSWSRSSRKEQSPDARSQRSSFFSRFKR